MKVVIVGGGMVGMTLAHLLRRRGLEPTIIERMPAGFYQPRGYMLGFQGYESLQEVGVYDEVRDAGRPIAPREGQPPIAVAVRFGALIEALQRDLPMENELTVKELITDEIGRVTGVVAEPTPEEVLRGAAGPTSAAGSLQTAVPGTVKGDRPAGEIRFEADLVVACDGVRSPIRDMAGLSAEIDPLPEAALSFYSPKQADTSFAMAYMSDGGHIGMLSWYEGSAGWRSCARVGAEAALDVTVDQIKEMWTRLLPESASAVEGVTSMDQVRYSEPALLRCPEWWKPGIVLIGDAAHFFGPETGVSSGIGLGDAHALAEAIRQNPNDADAACHMYQTWREPVVRPYEATDPGRQRILVSGQVEPRPEERWPPED
ncbi:MAG: FAD-dependent monooxygenase [Actinobacteria bacterium]|nr:FAD-dependent monooxygenase [Thermoleophilia bacterium]MCB9010387.1 FAD-dependent monooxygenase [Actinomycetota bacterium]